MGEPDNMRRALETIRDLTGADVEQGPEIAETALEAVDYFAALRASKPEVENLVEALRQIEEGMTHVRAPHRLSAAKALAHNTLRFALALQGTKP